MKTTTLLATVAVALLVTLGAAQDYYDEPAPRRAAPRPAPSASYNNPSGPKPTPVAILKQINRHNEDGSYTYGYEGADGTFKIETKLPTGEVKGKYGYLDDVGKVRVVEYGANKYGFQPAGEGITVAPPTLVDDSTDKNGLTLEYDQYGQTQAAQPQRVARPRPVQQPEYDFQSAPRFAPAPQPLPQRAQVPGAAPVDIDYTAPAPRFASRPAPAPVHTFSPAPVSRPRPAPVQEDISYADPAPRPRPVPQFRPAPQQPQFSAPPQYATAPAPAPRPVSRPVQPQPGRGGVLDQLARDYALPQDSAAPLHDISFGYY